MCFMQMFRLLMEEFLHFSNLGLYCYEFVLLPISSYNFVGFKCSLVCRI